MELQWFLDVNCVVGELNTFCSAVYINGDTEGMDKICGKYYKRECRYFKLLKTAQINTISKKELQLFVDVSRVVGNITKLCSAVYIDSKIGAKDKHLYEQYYSDKRVWKYHILRTTNVKTSNNEHRSKKRTNNLIRRHSRSSSQTNR